MSYDVVLARSANATQYGQNLPEIHEPQNVEFMPSTAVQHHGLDNGGLSPTKHNTHSNDNNATPSRKCSSKIMSALTQFYGNDDGSSDQMIASTSSSIITTNKHIGNADDSYPEIKSKLISMWHNVKYGKFILFCFLLFILIVRNIKFF